ncbi:M48 family metalloprotease [Ideonella sp. BN130291]|uniref:M48 family metalloprotease n=1 Tax=Ideonella sp. BN130291 TaxID=3112940 RepID=UPI002E262B7A|nr:M48 family metalloprotease [Ideonella sp. BN130291]
MRHALVPLVIALACGCTTTVQNPVTGQPERTVMDERSEVQEGAKEHQAVLAEYGTVQDPRVQAYVTELGRRLARQSERAQLDWHFTVLDSPEVNAFALPGGYVYVTRGIMAYMDSEADLAGVMGHEIGHVTARHGAQRATKQQTAGLGVLAATVLGAILEGRGVSGAGQVASQISQTAAAGYIAHYSRDQELQADRLGAEYLSRAGYNPRNMVDVIQLLRYQDQFAAEVARSEGRTAQQGPSWLASHPSNEQRLHDITSIAANYRGSYGDDGRARYQQLINGMAFGETREQGVTRGRNFYHEPLGFAITAPAGWKIQNEPNAVALVNPDSTAGLVLQMVPEKAGSSAEDILRNVIKPEQGRTERYSINGMPATHFAGTRRNEQGRAEPVEATVVSGPSGRNYLLAYSGADAASLQRAHGQMREAEASFRPLSAADRNAARPWTVRTVPYPRGGFAELARQSPLPHAERHLRLLNGFYGGGEPAPGQLVKTVQ